MYNEAFSLGQCPPSFTIATINLLLKKDKDPFCGSFRPISLLNVDYKILAKILPLHLQQFLLRIISSDQTGFMLGRHSFHNTRRLLNILNMPSSRAPEVVVLLDAEKAFDRVEWDNGAINQCECGKIYCGSLNGPGGFFQIRHFVLS